jgi:DNA-binding GntR family transcriptional regulator
MTRVDVVDSAVANWKASDSTVEPTTEYRRVLEDLVRRIESGELAPGEKLPSTVRLAGEYGVSISTIHRVTTTLEDRKLIRGVPGKARYVRVP